MHKGDELTRICIYGEVFQVLPVLNTVSKLRSCEDDFFYHDYCCLYFRANQTFVNLNCEN